VAPIIAAGQVVQQANTLTGSFQIKFGSTVASATYDGLAPNAVGFYQFNVVVPSIPLSDAVPVTFSLNGVAGTQTLYTSVQNGAPAATIQSLTLVASTVPAGGTVAGTVTLSQAAPAGGAVLALSSNSPSATVPATVTVAAGATSATFTIYAPEVAVPATVTITATYQGSSATVTLTVQD
jgi:hypothetical protein